MIRFTGDESKVDPSILSGRVHSGSASARITLDGRDYLNFFGAGYLTLSYVPEVRKAVQDQLALGAALSRQIPAALGAIDPIFQAVERSAARACGTETSLYLPSGYLIGMAGLAGLESSFDLCALDELAHYCLKDAAKLTGLPVFTFAHGDADSLAKVLRSRLRAGQKPLVITDGVFPTSGRLAPLSDYAAVVEPYGGRLFIDESHAFGVVGEKGRGAAEYCGVEAISSSGSTLSKTYCAHGAVLGCTQEQYHRLLEAPVVRGACAGSPLLAAAAAASLNYVAGHPEMRAQLRSNADYLRQRLREIGVDTIDSPAPIVSFQVGTAADMQRLQHRLFAQGIHIYHSRYLGAGPEGMIRCAVFRDHTRGDLDTLIDAIRCATLS